MKVIGFFSKKTYFVITCDMLLANYLIDMIIIFYHLS